jgi:anaerobic ribonucleoside-triphosphate reductase
MPTLEQAIKKHRTILAEYNPSNVEDDNDHEWLWEDFIYEVEAMMKKMRTKKFFAYGLSLTWRNVAGYTEFETFSARTLVDKLTPNSEFSIQFLKTENKGIIEVIISHHDKPMGETMYLMSQTMEKKQGIKESYFN